MIEYEKKAGGITSNVYSGKRVAVILASYNGARYLKEQVNSIIFQEMVEVTLFIYDDGSTDNSVATIKELCQEHNRDEVRINSIISSNNIGFPSSFFAALNVVPDAFDFYSFADQDDVWASDKLISAINAINGVGEVNVFNGKESPCLYIEPTTYVDENLNFLYQSSLRKINPTIPSFFTRARCAAHTMVFDKNLKKQISIIGKNHCGFSHGYLALICCAASAGTFYIGSTSHTQHRRLSSSVSNGGKGILNRIKAEYSNVVLPSIDRSKISNTILEVYNRDLRGFDREYLISCSQYKKSLGAKLRLLQTKNFCCGIAAANIEAWFACLINKF